MLAKETIFELIKQNNLSDNTKFDESKRAFFIEKEKNNIKIKILIPINVYEIFFEAIDLGSKKIIKDWTESYGDNVLEDYEDELKTILRTLNERNVRFSNDAKTLEYEDQKNWKYFFGDFKKEYWGEKGQKI